MTPNLWYTTAYIREDFHRRGIDKGSSKEKIFSRGLLQSDDPEDNLYRALNDLGDPREIEEI